MLLGFTIPPLNRHRGDQLDAYLQSFGLPQRSLGKLENIVSKLVSVQNTYDVSLRQLHHLVFCADHGVHSRLVQPGALTTALYSKRLLVGKAPAAKACEQYNVDLTVVDCGMLGAELAPHPNLVTHRVASGSRDFSTMAAMTMDDLTRAVEIGRDQASLSLAAGTRVLSFAAVGLGNELSAAALCMALINIKAKTALAHQNSKDQQHELNQIEILTQALALHREQCTDGWQAVRCLGGYEIAAIMGAMCATAELGAVFLVDGFACAAALLALQSVYPDIVDYAQFSNQSCYTGQSLIMRSLNQEPLLNLQLSLGDGIGSILAWPLVCSAVEFLSTG